MPLARGHNLQSRFEAELVVRVVASIAEEDLVAFPSIALAAHRADDVVGHAANTDDSFFFAKGVKG